MAEKLKFVATLFVCGLVASSLLAQEDNSETKDRQIEAAQETQSVVNTTPTEPPKSVNLEFLNLGEAPKSVTQLRAMEELVAELSERVKPAVVNIRVGDAQGSGVVVDRYGTILTAAHVIGGPNRTAFVTFPDGEIVEAKTLGVNRRMDSGMLKISEKGRYPYLDTGESALLNLGQWVMAIGHPGGIDPDRGLVVRVGRLLRSTDTTLRTDCTLVGGDSGGPLIDMDGYLIGIHSRIGGSLADNIHVPIDAFSNEWDELVQAKRVGEKPRPHLGFRLKEDTNEIESLSTDGPAEKAGIKTGDVITQIEDSEIENRSDLISALRKLKIGDKIKIVVERDDNELELELTVGERW